MSGIWIKAQSKGLYLCIGLDAPTETGYVNKPFVITGYVSDEIQPWLGWYATDTRALQVLDEIQQFIVDCEHCKDNKMFYPVFQMDEE